MYNSFDTIPALGVRIVRYWTEVQYLTIQYCSLLPVPSNLNLITYLFDLIFISFTLIMSKPSSSAILYRQTDWLKSHKSFDLAIVSPFLTVCPPVTLW